MVSHTLFIWGKKKSSHLSSCRQCSPHMDMILLGDVSCFYIFWLCQLHTSHHGPEINFKLILFRQEVRTVGLLGSSESWSPPPGDDGYLHQGMMVIMLLTGPGQHRTLSGSDWLQHESDCNVLHGSQQEKDSAEYASLWKSRWGPKRSRMFVNLAIIYMKIYKGIYPFNG